MIEENKDKIDEADKTATEEALDKAREALKGDDLEAIKTATDDVNSTTHKIAEALYKTTAEEGAAEGEATGEQAEEGEVVDAEVVDAAEAEEGDLRGRCLRREERLAWNFD